MSKRPSGKLRIIGGQWRTRLVDFDPATGIRPTPDRVRQTLFDWLAPLIEGARCLDLFAGSGALGLEALSRGAAHVTFVDDTGLQCNMIRAALAQLLATERAEVVQQEALEFLAKSVAPMGRSYDAVAPPFDIAFLDPPFDSALLAPVLERLPRLLTPDNRVYVERHHAGAWSWPAGYAPLREKKAGQVSYALATYIPEKAGGKPDA